jgi:hypothetical protein
MREYLRSRLVQVGLGLLILGTGPLLFIIVAAAVGLWPDPNPNPIGPGLLAFLTFWPSVFCILIGMARVRTARDKAREAQVAGDASK